jgi:hypothetical protein
LDKPISGEALKQFVANRQARRTTIIEPGRRTVQRA